VNRSTKQLQQLIDKFGNECHYCGEQTNSIPNSKQQATKEHVVPRAFGGGNTMENYVLACSECNNERGTTLFYCQCEYYCSPLIEEALARQDFIDGIFKGIVDHNVPKVFKNSEGVWTIRLGHARRHKPTWEEAIEFALNWKVLDGLQDTGSRFGE
jgi:hypothetical protein